MKRSSIFFALSLAAAVPVFGQDVPMPTSTPQPPAPARVTASVPASEVVENTVPRILVIPFNVLNVPEGQQWIGKGVQETIVADIGRSGAAMPLTFDGPVVVEDNATAIRVAKAAGAAYVIRGTAQVVGEQVRITAQVLDVRTGDTLRNTAVTGKVGDILAMEDTLTEQLRGNTAVAANTPPATGPAGGATTAQVLPNPPAVTSTATASAPATGAVATAGSGGTLPVQITQPPYVPQQTYVPSQVILTAPAPVYYPAPTYYPYSYSYYPYDYYPGYVYTYPYVSGYFYIVSNNNHHHHTDDCDDGHGGHWDGGGHGDGGSGNGRGGRGEHSHGTIVQGSGRPSGGNGAGGLPIPTTGAGLPIPSSAMSPIPTRGTLPIQNRTVAPVASREAELRGRPSTPTSITAPVTPRSVLAPSRITQGPTLPQTTVPTALVTPMIKPSPAPVVRSDPVIRSIPSVRSDPVTRSPMPSIQSAPMPTVRSSPATAVRSAPEPTVRSSPAPSGPSRSSMSSSGSGSSGGSRRGR